MVKVAHGDLGGFSDWWEGWRNRPFDPALLRERDPHTWRVARQYVFYN